MKRQNSNDINTPERYDELFFGERTNELNPYTEIQYLLEMLNPKGEVLDIGCGLGRYFTCFEGSKISATELSIKCIADIIKSKPYVNVHQWFAGYPLPFNDEQFDLVFCGEMLEHVENPKEVLREIFRKVKIGGWLILTFPYKDSIKCEEHLWEYDEEDIVELFEGSSFNYSVFRYSNEPVKRYEHFCIIAKRWN